MNLKKAQLQKVLKTLSAFDSGGSPYMGMQTAKDGVEFFRSSPSGYIHTLGWNPAVEPAIVSLPHFKEVLGVLRDEQIDVGFDANGIVRLTSQGSGWSDDLRVHTVRVATPWSSPHRVGDEVQAVEPTAFNSINVGPFVLASPPILKEGCLMLPTDSGVVVRCEVPAESVYHPREGFLRAVHIIEPERIYTTSGGYWGAVGGGFSMVVCGHSWGDNLFHLYRVPGQEIAQLPAGRLLNTLDSAAILCGEGQKVEISPRTGVSTRDQYGSPGVWTFGETGTWAALSILNTTAKTIVNALRQSVGEIAILSKLPDGGYRLTRGQWAVNFRSY